MRNFPRCHKGQGATEYLVIAAVVLVIALVSISLLGFYPGTATDAKATQSNAYWVTARPTGVYDAKTTEAVCNSSSRGYTLTLENHESTPIRLTNITIAGQGTSFCRPGQTAASEIRLETGEKVVIDVPAGISSAAGKSISANITISYTTVYGTANVQRGTTPLVIGNSLPPQAITGESCATLSCASGYTCNASSVCEVAVPLSIGMSYQGGKIAYLDGTGQHGLIAATSDQIAGSPDGKYTWVEALYWIVQTGGYSDWYLPSKNELNQIYTNRAAVGGFTSNWYWSSTPYNDVNAWLQNFGSGSQSAGGNNGYYYVRAVRAF